MASSSSSASNSPYYPRWKYAVFLNFRGEDTRKTFAGHLYQGLKNRGIFTFQDDKRLEHGESISEELLKAIEESQVAIVIFSKNYATSRWCLNELVKIMECKDKNGQTVIPIFYDVDPSHVRKQTESFAHTFAEHELKYKGDSEGLQKVQVWRNALTAAANLKGYDIRNGIESENIQEIVDHISKSCKSVYSLSSSQDVVGINTHLEKAKSLLEIERNDDVRILGIWGMGGVGKTTIATAIFHTLSDQFKTTCFLEDVKEIAKTKQLFSLQNMLLSKLLGKKDDYVNNKHNGKLEIPNRLCRMKVLIVLDDIDHIDHLEYLAGDIRWFGNGSRVIVTTRNKRLIEKTDAIIYELTPLPDLEAMQLFNQHAFKGKVPDEFKNLSLEVVNYAKGLPLALKVWGSMLYKRDKDEWTSAIEKMGNNSNSDIDKNLRISYDGLESGEQTIFLDIACFFRGHNEKKVMQILESCHCGAKYILSVLIDKSLLFISICGTIEMHDLIQDMGQNIVKMQEDPGERSRLWDVEDIKEVMLNNTGKKATEAIWVRRIQKLCLREKAMKKMKRLRIFSNYGDSIGIEYLPNNLRCFVNYNYPRESLPEKFGPKRLVYLDLRRSSLRHLWTGIKHFPFLRKLDLSWSRSLMRTPDFRKMPNLEYLDLSFCTNIEEVDDSLGYCGKLIRLDLGCCSSLKSFPCVNLESLEYLRLRNCCSLEKFPEIRGRWKSELKIEMVCSRIMELPSSFFQPGTHLTKLDLSFMKDLVCLPSSIGMFKNLVELNVSFFSKLKSLPKEIGDLENLEKLDASYTLISRPPSSIAGLNKLKFLSFKNVGLQDGVYFKFPQVNDGLRSLENLDLSYCNLIDGGLPEDIGSLTSLKELRLSHCNLIDGGLPEDIGSLTSLKELRLSGNNFEHLPQSIAELGALQSLDVSFCKRLKEFPQVNDGLRSLEELDLSNCNLRDGGLPEDIGSLSSLKNLRLISNDFEHLPQSIAQLGALQSLHVSYCRRLKKFPQVNDGLRSLEVLGLCYCNLRDGGLPEDIGSLSSLKELRLSRNNFEHLPRSISQLGALRILDVSTCMKLKEFPQVNDGLRSLEMLDLRNCNLRDGGLREDIGSLSSLKELRLSGNNFEHLPRSISQLGALRILDVSNCMKLKEFPQVNDGLRSLEELALCNCNLRDGGLPEDIGSLSSLKKLSLVGNDFEHLPRSIAQLGALQSLRLSRCMKLTQLPEFPQKLDTIDADWSNDWICNSLFQNISSLQHGISASDSLRVFTSRNNIPSWFQHWGIDKSVSVNLPENWYVSDNFLGFAVCYSGSLIEPTAQLIPLCDDGMTQKLALSNHSKYDSLSTIQFFLVPLASLWDTSKANGKTPNNYRLIRLFFSGELERFGVHLLYKDEPKLGKRQSRCDNSETSSSSHKKQRSHSNIHGSSVFENLQQ